MRLIDADAMIKRVEEWNTNDPTDRAMYNFTMHRINEQPTIEPERKTGKWIDNHTTCSECGWQMIDDVTQTPNMVGFNYCPNCGTKMEEGGM